MNNVIASAPREVVDYYPSRNGNAARCSKRLDPVVYTSQDDPYSSYSNGALIPISIEQYERHAGGHHPHRGPPFGR